MISQLSVTEALKPKFNELHARNSLDFNVASSLNFVCYAVQRSNFVCYAVQRSNYDFANLLRLIYSTSVELFQIRRV